jgi:hypothetical protein
LNFSIGIFNGIYANLSKEFANECGLLDKSTIDYGQSYQALEHKFIKNVELLTSTYRIPKRYVEYILFQNETIVEFKKYRDSINNFLNNLIELRDTF